jgi:beta-glucanase (GH16 family)
LIKSVRLFNTLLAATVFVTACYATPPFTSKWKLVFSDEFNGSALDTLKWIPDNGPTHPSPTWMAEYLSTRWADNVVVSGGICHLVIRKQERVKGVPWTAASISTRQFRQQYGYFEARIRYAGASGVNNAFWLDTGAVNSGLGKHFEIDINEGHYPAEVNLNFHDWSGEKDHPDAKKLSRAGDLSQGFHVYGLKWTEHELAWYIDDKEIWRQPITSGLGQTRVILSTMVMLWAGPVNDSLANKSMDIDWVRVYQGTGQ